MGTAVTRGTAAAGAAGASVMAAAGTRGTAAAGAAGAGMAGTTGYRSDGLRERIAREGRWRDVAYADEGDGERIDPRTLSIGLDDLLPAERTVAIDSGNFMGYPS